MSVKNSKYKKEYCELLIDYMGKGNSFQTFGVDLDVGRSTIYDWVDRHPEFKKAYEKGKEACRKWFENRLRLCLSGQDVPGIDAKKIDKTLLIFALKTRFHDIYGEKKEVTVKTDREDLMDYLNE